MSEVEVPHMEGLYPVPMNTCPVCERDGRSVFLFTRKGYMSNCPECGSHFAILMNAETMKRRSDAYYDNLGIDSPHKNMEEFTAHLDKWQFLRNPTAQPAKP